MYRNARHRAAIPESALLTPPPKTESSFLTISNCAYTAVCSSRVKSVGVAVGVTVVVAGVVGMAAVMGAAAAVLVVVLAMGVVGGGGIIAPRGRRKASRTMDRVPGTRYGSAGLPIKTRETALG